MKRSYILPGIAGLLIIGMGILAFVRRADFLILNPHGPIAAAEQTVIITTVLLAGIIVVPLFGLLAWFSYRYRASRSGPKGRHQPDWDHDSAIAEFSWWLVPTVIVIILSIIVWVSTYKLDPFKPLAEQNSDYETVNVQAIALQWKWLFIYPDLGIATVNEIEFPAGTAIHFEVTSDAPMNQFWIPSLGGQIMAMPGMSNQINLLATESGTFKGLSSNISGEGFAGMTFTAKAVSRQEFMTWVQQVKSTHNSLNRASYASLAVPSSYVPARYFSSVDEGIYTASMTKYSGSMMPMQQGMRETSATSNNAAAEITPNNTMSVMSESHAPMSSSTGLHKNVQPI
jgi:cytochrome o ubiquinol oxidase subunit 2